MNGTNSVTLTLDLIKLTKAHVTNDTLTAELADGRTISVPINWYPRLAYGTPQEHENYQISGAGYGLHWPDLDEDIGLEGILLGKKSTESTVSFERWLARRAMHKSLIAEKENE